MLSVNVRLIMAVFSTLLEEAALAVIVLLGLPRLGIRIPLGGLITLMVAWAAGAAVLYEVGSRALRRKPIVGLPSMIGGKGKVVSSLAPEGLVRIKDELWIAASASGTIDIGEEVTVLEQDGLKLVVRRSREVTR